MRQNRAALPFRGNEFQKCTAFREDLRPQVRVKQKGHDRKDDDRTPKLKRDDIAHRKSLDGEDRIHKSYIRFQARVRMCRSLQREQRAKGASLG